MNGFFLTNSASFASQAALKKKGTQCFSVWPLRPFWKWIALSAIFAEHVLKLKQLSICCSLPAYASCCRRMASAATSTYSYWAFKKDWHHQPFHCPLFKMNGIACLGRPLGVSGMCRFGCQSINHSGWLKCNALTVFFPANLGRLLNINGIGCDFAEPTRMAVHVLALEILLQKTGLSDAPSFATSWHFATGHYTTSGTVLRRTSSAWVFCTGQLQVE